MPCASSDLAARATVITVVEDWKLDSRYVQNFTVQVLILPDGLLYGSILVNMTLIMIGMIFKTSHITFLTIV